MKTFLGIGECMVELCSEGPALWRQSFSGDVFNTLWYARAFLQPDWAVEFYSAVGTDQVSDGLISFAETSGVSCRWVLREKDRMPGLYMIHLKNGERSFSYWRDTSAAKRMMTDIGRAKSAIDAADLIYFSGITMAILPQEDAVKLIELLAGAHAAGKVVCFDPNIRPRLWSSPEAMRRVISLAAAAATIVLPSFDDEAAAFGDGSPHETAARYASLGCRHVVVKNGGAPATVRNVERTEEYPSPEITIPVDTTAAGDSFNAAYLSEFLITGDVAAAVAAAQACSLKVVKEKGALVDVR